MQLHTYQTRAVRSLRRLFMRVLRWLTRLAMEATSRAARAQPEHRLYEIAKAETLTQMVDHFARGREG